ncbi:uncharacterized protein LACBIDRAFT_335213 [Laccaria bicolor S238N-H82]|uniref:Predicted protein n=1 Tax=Laccaria bicolor (strain S238N-H82 / ATCC MYA-4686) TaxID=486041 RepID=B0E1Q0_LACBS|nr:uncharacterized protein LACBIDRAFT_335213 [Laccaria bicolor S238N-H82]EDQ99233.1 predicted protein [Laccaria bicolor S238N-H82]|eukprot:XP_001890130.1 predicted protein [Laccaria bicolor S238N-H82]
MSALVTQLDAPVTVPNNATLWTMEWAQSECEKSRHNTNAHTHLWLSSVDGRGHQAKSDEGIGQEKRTVRRRWLEEKGDNQETTAKTFQPTSCDIGLPSESDSGSDSMIFIQVKSKSHRAAQRSMFKIFHVECRNLWFQLLSEKEDSLITGKDMMMSMDKDCIWEKLKLLRILDLGSNLPCWPSTIPFWAKTALLTSTTSSVTVSTITRTSLVHVVHFERLKITGCFNLILRHPQIAITRLVTCSSKCASAAVSSELLLPCFISTTYPLAIQIRFFEFRQTPSPTVLDLTFLVIATWQQHVVLPIVFLALLHPMVQIRFLEFRQSPSPTFLDIVHYCNGFLIFQSPAIATWQQHIVLPIGSSALLRSLFEFDFSTSGDHPHIIPKIFSCPLTATWQHIVLPMVFPPSPNIPIRFLEFWRSLSRRSISYASCNLRRSGSSLRGKTTRQHVMVSVSIWFFTNNTHADTGITISLATLPLPTSTRNSLRKQDISTLLWPHNFPPYPCSRAIILLASPFGFLHTTSDLGVDAMCFDT